jgi:hypothetical protein
MKYRVLFHVGIVAFGLSASCTPGAVGDNNEGESLCGEPPELSYVCANNEYPCECVGEGEEWHWQCSDCEAVVDCAANPSDPMCEKDASCIGCHGLASSDGGEGIENSHPWADLGCTACHGGDGTVGLSKDQSHVSIPREMAAGDSTSVPNQTFYKNYYLGRAGVENLSGGLEWIRFMNPGDLRIVESTCAQDACHAGAGEKVRRSTMSTLVGKYDAMLYLAGMGRAPELRSQLGNTSYDKRLATYGAIGVVDDEFDTLHSNGEVPPGAVRELVPLIGANRESEKPFGVFTEDDVLKETINKLCGDCHLNNNGSNNRYGQFRSAGCSSCHLPYDYSGKSKSGDRMISKQEPTYPEAYKDIQYPERPHPRSHQLKRTMSSEDCLPCHTGSNRTVFQAMGIRTDDNRDLTRAKAAGANINFKYSNLIDNTLNPEARLHGFTQDQLIEFEDLDGDGLDDTPPDVHFEAGLECIDCHNASEMHGDGRIYSRQNQATKVRCVHCHGNLEFPADPDAETNPVNELFFTTGRKLRKTLWTFDKVPTFGEDGFPFVTVPGVWMRTKSKGEWKYVTQIAWGVKWNPENQQCFDEGEKVDPRTNTFVCSPESSVAHGRWQGLNQSSGDFDDGVGPRPGVEVITGGDGSSPTVRFGFSHIGEATSAPNQVPAGGLECSSCHAAWHNMRYGNHLGLIDTDGVNRFYEWDRVTGESTIGKQQFFNFTFVDNLLLQLGINAKGKFQYFIPTRLKMFVRSVVLDTSTNSPLDFMTRVGDPGHVWKTYRDRVGFGNLIYNSASGVTGAPGYAQVCVEPGGFCDQNPNKNTNASLGVDQMEPHSLRREARSCTDCHMNQGSSNSATISAVYGWNPQGYTPATRAYLNKIKTVQSPQGTYSTANGFVIADDGIDHRLDYLVDENTGYPLASTVHVRTDDGRDGRPSRGYETYDRDAAGPVTKSLIELLKRVKVRDAN